jgi:CheY-like chemotaxis protein
MRKVFIIDDDPIHQKIAQIMLNKHNLFDEYTSYTEAIHALEFLDEHKAVSEDLPDVILLDLNMPVINGWDFLDRYDQLVPGLKKISDIYIVSSSVDQNDKQRSTSYQYVKGFVSKPISSAMLVALLKSD